MKKICVIVGHGGRDCGAVNNDTGDTELNFNMSIKDKLIEELNKRGYETAYHNRGNAKVENLNIVNGTKANITISLHCNAANGMATGSEMLYWNSSVKGKILANILSEKISNTLGLINRGSKPKKMGDRGAYLLRYTQMPCVIVEPFFIDNNADLEKAKSKTNEYINTLADSIDEYFQITKK